MEKNELLKKVENLNDRFAEGWDDEREDAEILLEDAMNLINELVKFVK